MLPTWCATPLARGESDAPVTFSPGAATPSSPTSPARPAAAPLDDDEPRHPDLQVLLIMSWDYPGAEAKLRELEAIDGPFDRLRKQGWTVGLNPTDNVRIVSTHQVSALVERLRITQFPAVVAVADGQVVRSFTSGCTTPLDEHTFGWLRTGVGTRPASAPRPAPTVATSGNYPLRGAHWSVDGDWNPPIQQLVQHLRSPMHQHLFPAGWNIERWAYQELLSLHDDLHETGRPRGGGNGLTEPFGTQIATPAYRYPAGGGYGVPTGGYRGSWSNGDARSYAGAASRSSPAANPRRIGSPAQYVP